MLFIENQHVATSVNERYRFIMRPFYHKLSNYFKFVADFSIFMRVKDQNAEYIRSLLILTKEIDHLAHPCIMNGQDYPINFFNADKLEDICNNINGIWQIIDRRCGTLSNHIYYETEKANKFCDIGKGSLHEISTKYDMIPWDMNLLMSVSGDFFCKEWQPIKDVPYQYELWQKKTTRFSMFTILCISVSLLTLTIILLLRFLIPIWIITALTTMSIILLGATIYLMVNLNALSAKLFG